METCHESFATPVEHNEYLWDCFWLFQIKMFKGKSRCQGDNSRKSCPSFRTLETSIIVFVPSSLTKKDMLMPPRLPLKTLFN